MSHALEYLNRIVRGELPPPPISKLLGFALTHVERGRATVELSVDDRHTNPFGGIHGGLICDIADAAMGAAFHTTLEGDESCSTLEMKTSFVKAASPGKLRAEGYVIREGKSVGFLECNVTDGKDRLVAKASATLLKLKRASNELSESHPSG